MPDPIDMSKTRTVALVFYQNGVSEFESEKCLFTFEVPAAFDYVRLMWANRRYLGCSAEAINTSGYIEDPDIS